MNSRHEDVPTTYYWVVMRFDPAPFVHQVQPPPVAAPAKPNPPTANMRNAWDAARLRSAAYRQREAVALADGIEAFLRQS